MGGEKLTKRKRVVEDRNCDGDCIQSDLERVGEQWRKRATDRRNLRLDREHSERHEKKKIDIGKGSHSQVTCDPW